MKKKKSLPAGRQGKLIVIDGTDGSGKATQTKMLVKRLKKAGYPVKVADFPQYGKKSAGLVEEYLNGKYGNAKEVGPHRASIFYACDRYDASFQIKKWIKEGCIIISNRYVTANMGHQGGKIENREKRKKYFNWLYKLEYEMFNIPKPDLNIILHVDAAVAQKLVDGKGIRNYLKRKKRDLHEKDLKHLRDAERVYIEIGKYFPGFAFIECTKNSRILSREEISDLVWERLKDII
jgi:dTMP kinase